MDAHEKAVAVIAAPVGQFYERKEPHRIYHGSTNSTSQSRAQRDKMINTSSLLRVLSVDVEHMSALVEPNYQWTVW
jgi:Delta24-sterol reductase